MLHQGANSPTVVQALYVIPRWRKGKTQDWAGRGPDSVVQEGEVRDSVWQEEREETWQSPHLLVTTAPSESVCVAHHGVGESE